MRIGDYLDSIADLSCSKARFLSWYHALHYYHAWFFSRLMSLWKVTWVVNGLRPYSHAIFSCLHRRQFVVKFGRDVWVFTMRMPIKFRWRGSARHNNLSRSNGKWSYFGGQGLHPKTIVQCANSHSLFNPHSPNPIAPGNLISPLKQWEWQVWKGIVLTLKNVVECLNIAGPGRKGIFGMASVLFEFISRVIVQVV